MTQYCTLSSPTVVSPQTLSETAERLTEAYSDIEIRGKNEGLEVVSVSYPKRLVEVIVMPYESVARINEADREFEEIVSRGAFDGIQARNDKVRVNRDHEFRRTVGRAIAFHPSRQEGLVAEIRISRTDLGNDTLGLVEDGVLDASAGFRLLRKDGLTGPVVEDAMVWETRERRRLNKLWLHHIALTPDPAYDAAQVLAVRQKTEAENPARPLSNMERLELERLRETYAGINARYSPG